MPIDPDRRVIVLDFETTHLDPEQGVIIEVGALVCEPTPLLPVVGELFLRVRAEHPAHASKEALEVNGRSRESLSEGVSEATALAWLRPLIEGQQLAGHNVVGFEIAWLRREYQLDIGQEFWARDALDSKAMAARQLFRGEISSTSLAPLCAHFGVVNCAPHTARGDAMATREVLIHLLSSEAS